MESESQHIEIGGICCEAAFFKHTVCAILCTALKGQTEAKRRPSAWAVVLTSGTLDCRESKLTGLRHCQDRLWAKRGGPKKCSFSERERRSVCERVTRREDNKYKQEHANKYQLEQGVTQSPPNYLVAV